MRYFISLTFSIFTFLSGCASLPIATIPTEVKSILYPAELEGVRWGVLVSDLDGNILLEHNASQRFLPASNTKLFTTAAAFQWLEEFENQGDNLSTHAYLEANSVSSHPDLIVIGHGDPSIVDTPNCKTRCLSHLADEIANSGVKEINNLIVDSTWFPNEKWSGGWSWEDLQEGYGTAVSALTLNRNELNLAIRPAKQIGHNANASLLEDQGIFELVGNVLTVESDATGVSYERLPGSTNLHISGQIEISAPPQVVRLGVDEPSDLTASRLRQLLVERDIHILGESRVKKHQSDFAIIKAAGENCSGLSGQRPSRNSIPIASLPPPDWNAVLKTTNKASQNLYAEILLRQLGRICGNGTGSDGIGVIRQLLDDAGAESNGYDIFDGSGMSVYNRISPETIVNLLTYASDQEWGELWRNTFPIGGVDGGLKNRFSGTSLEKRIFAKTGTLKGVNALSGYMISSTGKTLAFSILANDRPLHIGSSTPFMDAALISISEQF